MEFSLINCTERSAFFDSSLPTSSTRSQLLERLPRSLLRAHAHDDAPAVQAARGVRHGGVRAAPAATAYATTHTTTHAPAHADAARNFDRLGFCRVRAEGSDAWHIWSELPSFIEKNKVFPLSLLVTSLYRLCGEIWRKIARLCESSGIKLAALRTAIMAPDWAKKTIS